MYWAQCCTVRTTGDVLAKLCRRPGHHSRLRSLNDAVPQAERELSTVLYCSVLRGSCLQSRTVERLSFDSCSPRFFTSQFGVLYPESQYCVVPFRGSLTLALCVSRRPSCTVLRSTVLCRVLLLAFRGSLSVLLRALRVSLALLRPAFRGRFPSCASRKPRGRALCVFLRFSGVAEAI